MHTYPHPSADLSALEQARVVRDLRGDVIQVLAGLAYALEAEEAAAGRGNQPGLPAPAHSVLTESIEKLQSLSDSLRTPDLGRVGLPETLARLTDSLTVDGGVRAALTVRDAQGLGPERSRACYRVAREALSNIARHARAGNVCVAVTCRDGQTVLTIRDDGVGFDADAVPAEGRLGLRIMGVAAATAGGVVHIRSSLCGGGTCVSAVFTGAEPAPWR